MGRIEESDGTERVSFMLFSYISLSVHPIFAFVNVTTKQLLRSR